MQNRPKLTVKEAKIKVNFFHFLGNLINNGEFEFENVLVILVFIFEIRASKNAKKAENTPKMTKN